MVQIRDRIIDFRRVKASELRPNPKNWRTHPEAQANALRGVLAEVGYVDALLARVQPDGGLMLLDGHLRAETTPDMEVPVLVVDLDDAEAAKVLATFDPLAAMAEADAGKLDAILREFETSSEDLATMLDALAKEAGCEWANQITKPIDVPLIDPPSQPTTKLGDLWHLGKHRLVCGSSSNFDDLKRLFGEAKPDIAVIDPPFECSDEWVRHIMDPCIVFGTAKHIRMIPESLWRFERVIDKVTKHRGPTTLLCSRHALVAQCGTKRVVPRNKRLSFDSIVTHEERPNHPHEKPVDLLVDHLTHYTPLWSLVFDPYSGSGSTFMAANAMERACYGCELSPAYCDVIVARWETATGCKARLGGSDTPAPSRRPRKSLAR